MRCVSASGSASVQSSVDVGVSVDDDVGGSVDIDVGVSGEAVVVEAEVDGSGWSQHHKCTPSLLGQQSSEPCRSAQAGCAEHFAWSGEAVVVEVPASKPR